MSLHPLVVDLDGTLIRTDMLHEFALRVLRDRPFDTLRIPYWLSRGKAVLKRHLAKKAGACCEVKRGFSSPAAGFTAWRRVLCAHQWLKNLLLFVPLFAAHQITNLDTWLALILAFFSFNLCASSVYIANDLLDLESDRLHPRKCKRPFASGLVPAWMGVVLAPLLLLSSMALARPVGGTFLP